MQWQIVNWAVHNYFENKRRWKNHNLHEIQPNLHIDFLASKNDQRGISPDIIIP